MDSANGPYTIKLDASLDTKDNEINKLSSRLEKLEELENPTQYVFINKSLNLEFGKAVAQVAHAQEYLFYTVIKHFPESAKRKYLNCLIQNPRTSIILEAKDEKQIYKISKYLNSCEIMNSVYIDEAGPGYLLEATALVTEYVEKDSAKIKAIFKHFNLYEPSLDYITKSKVDKYDKLKLFLNEDFGAKYMSNKQFRKEIYEQFS